MQLKLYFVRKSKTFKMMDHAAFLEKCKNIIKYNESSMSNKSKNVNYCIAIA